VGSDAMPAPDERVTNATLARNDALILQRLEQIDERSAERDARMAEMFASYRADHDALTRLVAVVEAHQEQQGRRDKDVDDRIKDLQTRDKVVGVGLALMQGITALFMGPR
jgi:hypothetical protein